MEYKDYYQILGVSRGAPESQIKRAYRRLARRYHPDVNPGNRAAQEKFKEINEAYEVLSDPPKRQKYDQLGRDWQRWQQMGYDPSGFDWDQWFAQPGAGQKRVRVEFRDLGDLFSGESPFSEFFHAIFREQSSSPFVQTNTRTRPSSSGPARARDAEIQVEITLEEALSGTTRVVSIAEHHLEVVIPPGVKTGSRVRISGKGGERADLYLRISVAHNPRFERVEEDIYTEADIDLYTAVLGGEVRVPALDGDIMLKIPPETQSGKTFRLQGLGMPKLKAPTERGDLYVRVRVKIPEKLSPRERELFEQLGELRGR